MPVEPTQIKGHIGGQQEGCDSSSASDGESIVYISDNNSTNEPSDNDEDSPAHLDRPSLDRDDQLHQMKTRIFCCSQDIGHSRHTSHNGNHERKYLMRRKEPMPYNMTCADPRTMSPPTTAMTAWRVWQSSGEKHRLLAPPQCQTTVHG